MRKFNLLALAFVIGTASLFALNIDKPENPTKEIRNEIVKLLQSPDFEIEYDRTVILKFTFNSEGEIVVICAGCKDREIVDYIRENLNYKKFNSPGERDKMYSVPLTLIAG